MCVHDCSYNYVINYVCSCNSNVVIIRPGLSVHLHFSRVGAELKVLVVLLVLYHNKRQCIIMYTSFSYAQTHTIHI